jgi:Transposase DDE domain
LCGGRGCSRQGRYRTVPDNLRVKGGPRRRRRGGRPLRRLPQPGRGRARPCPPPAAARANRGRARPRLAEQRRRARSKAEREAHLRGECALRDHPTLSRYLRQTRTGRLLLDRAKVAAEERLDGKYLLTTSDPSLSAEDVALGYKQLQEAERSSRDLKGTLLLRPVFHRKDDRIRAHVLICFLALVLVRLGETRAGETWRTIRAELGQIRQGHFQSSDGDFTQTSELTARQRDLHHVLGVPEPPRFGRITPTATRAV